MVRTLIQSRNFPLRCISHHPDQLSSDLCAAAGNDGMVVLWDMRKKTQVMSLKVPSSALSATQLGFSSFDDGKHLIAAVPSSLLAWDIRKGLFSEFRIFLYIVTLTEQVPIRWFHSTSIPIKRAASPLRHTDHLRSPPNPRDC